MRWWAPASRSLVRIPRIRLAKTPRIRGIIPTNKRPYREFARDEDLLAERVGFEPTVGCPTHAFQACAFDRSAISPGAAGPRTLPIHLGRRRLGRRRAGGYRDSDRRDTRARSPDWGGRAAWLRHIFASAKRWSGRCITSLRRGIGLCLGGETHSTRTVSGFGCPLVRPVEACHRLSHAPATH